MIDITRLFITLQLINQFVSIRISLLCSPDEAKFCRGHSQSWNFSYFGSAAVPDQLSRLYWSLFTTCCSVLCVWSMHSLSCDESACHKQDRWIFAYIVLLSVCALHVFCTETLISAQKLIRSDKLVKSSCWNYSLETGCARADSWVMKYA